MYPLIYSYLTFHFPPVCHFHRSFRRWFMLVKYLKLERCILFTDNFVKNCLEIILIRKIYRNSDSTSRSWWRRNKQIKSSAFNNLHLLSKHATWITCRFITPNYRSVFYCLLKVMISAHLKRLQVSKYTMVFKGFIMSFLCLSFPFVEMP